MSGERDPDREAKELDAELARVQPRMERLLDVADEADAAKAALRAELASVNIAAIAAMHHGDYETAAALFEELATRYRGASFVGEADTYVRRAKDARSAQRAAKRVAKTRRGRR